MEYINKTFYMYINWYNVYLLQRTGQSVYTQLNVSISNINISYKVLLYSYCKNILNKYILFDLNELNKFVIIRVE